MLYFFLEKYLFDLDINLQNPQISRYLKIKVDEGTSIK